jgi:hypothetical protein
MTLQKSQMKAAVVHEIGCEIEDKLEGARAELAQQQGALQFGKAAAKAVAALTEHVKREFAEGYFDKMVKETPTEELAAKIASEVSRRIGTCSNLLTHLTQQIPDQIAKAKGRIQEDEAIIKMLKKKADAEVEKLKAIADAVARGDLAMEDGAPVAVTSAGASLQGAHPGMTLKQQRLAEEEAEDGGASPTNGANGAAEPQLPEPDEDEDAAEGAPDEPQEPELESEGEAEGEEEDALEGDTGDLDEEPDEGEPPEDESPAEETDDEEAEEAASGSDS